MHKILVREKPISSGIVDFLLWLYAELLFKLSKARR